MANNKVVNGSPWDQIDENQNPVVNGSPWDQIPDYKTNDDDSFLTAFGYGLGGVPGQVAEDLGMQLKYTPKPSYVPTAEWDKNHNDTSWASPYGLANSMINTGSALRKPFDRQYEDNTLNQFAFGLGRLPASFIELLIDAKMANAANPQLQVMGEAAGVIGAAKLAQSGILKNTPKVANYVAHKLPELAGEYANAPIKAIPEATMEQQDAIRGYIEEAKQNGTYKAGITEQEAEKVGQEVFNKNLLLLTATDPLDNALLMGKPVSKLGKYKNAAIDTLLGGTVNAVQENLQTNIPKMAAGKPWSMTDKEALVSSAVGFGGSAIPAAANTAYRSMFPNDDVTDNVTTDEDDNEKFIKWLENQKLNDADKAEAYRIFEEGTDEEFEALKKKYNYQGGEAKAQEKPKQRYASKESFINSIATQESGGDYDLVNKDSGATGKYQIMPENWPSWAKEAGLDENAEMTPENQEKVARFKLGQYYDKYGARGAAIAWYAGEGALSYSEEALNRKQGDNGEYPSINEYADQVLSRIGEEAPTTFVDMEEEAANLYGGNDYLTQQMAEIDKELEALNKKENATAEDFLEINDLQVQKEGMRTKIEENKERLKEIEQLQEESEIDVDNTDRADIKARRTYTNRQMENITNRLKRNNKYIADINHTISTRKGKNKGRATENQKNRLEQLAEENKALIERLQSYKAKKDNLDSIYNDKYKALDEAEAKAKAEAEERKNDPYYGKTFNELVDMINNNKASMREANNELKALQAQLKAINEQGAKGDLAQANQITNRINDLNNAISQVNNVNQQIGNTMDKRTFDSANATEAHLKGRAKYLEASQNKIKAKIASNNKQIAAIQERAEKTKDEKKIARQKEQIAALTKENEELTNSLTTPAEEAKTVADRLAKGDFVKVEKPKKQKKEPKQEPAKPSTSEAKVEPKESVAEGEKPAQKEPENTEKPYTLEDVKAELDRAVQLRRNGDISEDEYKDILAKVLKKAGEAKLEGYGALFQKANIDVNKKAEKPVLQVAQKASKGDLEDTIKAFTNNLEERAKNDDNAIKEARTGLENNRKFFKSSGLEENIVDTLIDKALKDVDEIEAKLNSVTIEDNPEYYKIKDGISKEYAQGLVARLKNAVRTNNIKDNDDIPNVFTILTGKDQLATEFEQYNLRDKVEYVKNAIEHFDKQLETMEDKAPVEEAKPVEKEPSPEEKQAIYNETKADERKAIISEADTNSEREKLALEKKKQAEKAIEDQLESIIVELKKGVGNGITDRYVDSETGAEVDASDLRGKEETKPGSSIRHERFSNNDNWYSQFFAQYKRQPTKADYLMVAEEMARGKGGWSPDSQAVRDAAGSFDNQAGAEIAKQNSEVLDYLHDMVQIYTEIAEEFKAEQEKDKPVEKKPAETPTGPSQSAPTIHYKVKRNTDKGIIEIWFDNETDFNSQETFLRKNGFQKSKGAGPKYWWAKVDNSDANMLASEWGLTDNVKEYDNKDRVIGLAVQKELNNIVDWYKDGVNEDELTVREKRLQDAHDYITKFSNEQMDKYPDLFDEIDEETEKAKNKIDSLYAAELNKYRQDTASKLKEEPKLEIYKFASGPSIIVPKTDNYKYMIKDMCNNGFKDIGGSENSYQIATKRGEKEKAIAIAEQYGLTKDQLVKPENVSVENKTEKPAVEEAKPEPKAPAKDRNEKPVEEAKKPSAFNGARAKSSMANKHPKKQKENTVFVEDEYKQRLARLKSKSNRLNAMPMFDPEFMADLFYVGGYHFEKGLRKFDAWAKQVLADYAEGKPFLKSVWNSIKGYKSSEPLDGDDMQAAFEYVGSKYFDEGKTNLEDIKEDLLSEEDFDGEYYVPYVEAAFQGMEEYAKIDIDKAEEETNNGPDTTGEKAPSNTAGDREGEEDTKPDQRGDGVSDVRDNKVNRPTKRNTPKGNSGGTGKPGGTMGGNSTSNGGKTDEEGNANDKGGNGNNELPNPNGESSNKELDTNGIPRDEQRGSKDSNANTRGRIDTENYSILENGNYHSNNPDMLNGNTDKPRYKANIVALNAINDYLNTGKMPTPEEKHAMAQYAGWGGFRETLFNVDWEHKTYAEGWTKENDELRELLGEDAWRSAWEHSDSQYFTPGKVVEKMWDLARRLGFKGGKILEPSMGVGNMYALMPEDLQANSVLVGVERERTTGEMAKLLYPEAHVTIQGYENQSAPDNSYDFIIGNVPFSKETPFDARYGKSFSKPLMVHDYFFVKAINQLRPGGIMMFITSNGTMDKTNSEVRQYLATKAELVGAIRMPTSTFNKTGAQVTTDIIVLRKRAKDLDVGKEIDEKWIVSSGVKIGDKTVKENEYFVAHPEMVMGTVSASDFRGGTLEVLAPTKAGELEERLNEAINEFPKDIMKAVESKEEQEYIDADLTQKENGVYLDDNGDVLIRQGDKAIKLKDEDFKPTTRTTDTIRIRKNKEKVISLIKLHQQYEKLREAELSNAENVEDIRKETLDALNEHINHVFTYTTVVRGKEKEVQEPFGNFLKLEPKVNKATKELEKVLAFTDELNWFAKVGDYGKQADLAALINDDLTPADILVKPTTRQSEIAKDNSVKGRFFAQVLEYNDTIDVKRIAEESNTPEKEVIDQLVKENAIYKLPTGEWQWASKYLSGHIPNKIKEAQAALSAGDKDMERNIKALEEHKNAPISSFLITAKVGASWVDAEDYEKFFAKMLNVESGVTVENDGGSWKVTVVDKSILDSTYAQKNFTFGNVKATRIFEAALNKKHVVARIPDPEDSKKTIVDEELTKKAEAAIDQLHMKFQNWLFNENSDRRAKFEKLYNDRVNAYVAPTFDASFLEFPGLIKELGGRPFKPRDHQASTYLQAMVNQRIGAYQGAGTGKTLEIAMMVMGLRMQGKFKKPLVVGHNANSQEIASDIKKFYPFAKVLYVPTLSGTKLSKEKVNRLLAQINTGDWDAIVLPHEIVKQKQIALPENILKSIMQEDLNAKYDAIYKIAEEEKSEMPEAVEFLFSEEEEEAVKKGTFKASEKIKRDEELRKSEKKFYKPRTMTAINEYKKMLANLKEMASRYNEQGGGIIQLDKTGIDCVLVDECHEFKKTPKDSTRNVKGLDTSSSGMGESLAAITGYINAKNQNKGVFLFSGTMITNTIPEIHAMMRMIMPDTLKEANLYHLDDWLNTFASAETKLEPSSDGEYEPVERLNEFVNVQDLKRIAANDINIVMAKDLPDFAARKLANGKDLNSKDLTKAERDELLNGRCDDVDKKNAPVGLPNNKVVNVSIPMSVRLKEALKEIQKIYSVFRQAGNGADPVTRKRFQLQGTIVKIQQLAPNIGVSIKNLARNLRDSSNSKLSMCVKNVVKHYKDGQEQNRPTCQIIFTESGADRKPGSRTITDVSYEDSILAVERKTQYTVKQYQMIDDLVERLVSEGIKRSEIAIMRAGMKSEEKAAVIDAVNERKIKVVIGGYATIGVGVNIQQDLRAIHHLDAVWQPGDLDQMDARAIRQGNYWNTVLNYRYIAPGFDSKKWSALLTKKGFIDAFTSKTNKARIMKSDAFGTDDSSANNDLAETLGVSTGDPRVVMKQSLEQQVKRYGSMATMFRGSQEEARETIKSLKDHEIPATEKRIAALKLDEKKYNAEKEKNAKEYEQKVTEARNKVAEAKERLKEAEAKYKTTKSKEDEDFVWKIKAEVTKAQSERDALPNDDFVVEIYNRMKGTWETFTDRAEAEKRMFVARREVSDNTPYCKYLGFDVKVEYIDGEPRFTFSGNFKLYRNSAAKFSAIRQLMNGIKVLIENNEKSLKSKQDSIVGLEESLKQPNPYETLADEYNNKLRALEKDMQDNPKPIPRWYADEIHEGELFEYDNKTWSVLGLSTNKANGAKYTILAVDEQGNEKYIPANEAIRDGFPVLDEEKWNRDPEKEVMDEEDVSADYENEIKQVKEAVQNYFSPFGTFPGAMTKNTLKERIFDLVSNKKITVDVPENVSLDIADVGNGIKEYTVRYHEELEPNSKLYGVLKEWAKNCQTAYITFENGMSFKGKTADDNVRAKKEAENLKSKLKNYAYGLDTGAFIIDDKGNVVENPESNTLYKVENQGKKVTEADKLAGQAVIDLIQKAGIEVVTDKAKIEKALGGSLLDAPSKAGVQYLKTKKGEVYGFTKNGIIYIDTDLINANTPLHEYTHIWDEVCQKRNPALWRKGVALMKQTPLWNEVKENPAYANIKDNENRLASEVHARLTGENGAEVIKQMAETTPKGIIAKLKQWLKGFWYYTKNVLTGTTQKELDSIDLEAWSNMPVASVVRGDKLGDMLKDKAGENGYKVSSGTFFSGGGLVDYALKNLINGQFAVEFDKQIAGVYETNNGPHMFNMTVQDFQKQFVKQFKGMVDYFHASPVCKNFSSSKANDIAGEDGIDIETAKATAEAIRELQPKVFTLENVPRYANSVAMKEIIKALEAEGYNYDIGVYDSADYGAATSRKRLLLRAVKDGLLPPKPQKTEKSKGWYNEVKDLIPSLPQVDLPNWMSERLGPSGIDLNNITKPLLILHGNKGGKLVVAEADEVAPALLASDHDQRIIMPGGKIYRATPRVLARITGLDDDYKLPSQQSLAYRIIGNGVPVKLTQAVFTPLLQQLETNDQNDIPTLKNEYLAPNGKPSNLTPKQWQQVRTPAFKKWFGDWENDPDNASKVVDENGEPLVAYHRTKNEFSKFNIDKDDEYAMGFLWVPEKGDMNNEQWAKFGKAMPLFVNIRNPLKVDAKGNDSDEIPKQAGLQYDNESALGVGLTAKEDGYDGAIILNVKDVSKIPGTDIIFFEPNQVKSATDNNGDFSKDNDDINFRIENEGTYVTDIKRAAEQILPIKASKVFRETQNEYDSHARVGLIHNNGNSSSLSGIVGMYLDQTKGITRVNRGARQEILAKAYQNAQNSLEGGDLGKFYSLKEADKVKRGVAAFMRLYARDKEQAQQEYPIYFSAFERMIEQPGNAKLKEKVDNFVDVVQQYEGLTAEGKARAAKSRPKAKETFTDKLKRALSYSKWFDDKNALKEVTEEIQKISNKQIEAEDDPYKQARLSSTTISNRVTALIKGPESKDPKKKKILWDTLNKAYDNVMKHKVFFSDIIEKVSELDERAKNNQRLQNYLKNHKFRDWNDALGTYLLANRFLEIWKTKPNYTGSMTKEQAKRMVDFAPKEIKEAAQLYYKFDENLLAVMKHEGLLSEESYDNLMKYEAYCPLFRDFADEQAFDKYMSHLGSPNGFGNISNGIKYLTETGSDRTVMDDPVLSMMRMTGAIISKCERNKVAQKLVALTKNRGVGGLVMKEYDKEGNQKHTANAQESVFTVYENGEKNAYRTTPELHNVLMGNVDVSEGILTFVDFLSHPAQVLRWGATTDPGFVTANATMDTMTAFLSSRNGFLPIIGTLHGLYLQANNDKLLAEFKMSGAAMGEWRFLDKTKEFDVLDEMAGHDTHWYDKNFMSKIAIGAYQKWMHFNELVENSNRIEEFYLAKKNGKSDIQAALDAKEVTTDFTRGGEYSRILNRDIPFFNAILQGGDRMRQVIMENPKVVIPKMAMLAAAAAYMWARYNDEDWWKEKTNEEKITAFHIPYINDKGKTELVRVPFPHEFGLITAGVTIAALEAAKQKNPAIMREWAMNLYNQVTPSFFFAAYRPILELVANYDFHFNSPVESSKYESLTKEARIGARTSSTAIYMGKASKAISDYTGVPQISPIQFDHLFRGYAGNMGKIIAHVPDTFTAEGPKPGDYWSSMPIIGPMVSTVRSRFVKDKYEHPKSVDDWYALKSELELYHNTYEKGMKVPYMLAVNKLHRDMVKIRKQIYAVRASQLPQERKDEIIETLDEKSIQLARIGLKAFSKYKR